MSTQNQRQPKRKPSMQGFQMPPEPQNIASTNPIGQTGTTATPSQHPQIPLSPAMVTAIKSSRKGKIPPGLQKYIDIHRKNKKGGK